MGEKLPVWYKERGVSISQRFESESSERNSHLVDKERFQSIVRKELRQQSALLNKGAADCGTRISRMRTAQG